MVADFRMTCNCCGERESTSGCVRGVIQCFCDKEERLFGMKNALLHDCEKCPKHCKCFETLCDGSCSSSIASVSRMMGHKKDCPARIESWARASMKDDRLIKGLSFIEPWASLVLWGEKKYETRGYQPSNKPRFIALQISKNFPDWVEKTIRENNWFWQTLQIHGVGRGNPKEHFKKNFGKIIGVAVLGEIDTTENAQKSDYLKNRYLPPMTEKEKAFGIYDPKRFVWEMKYPRWLKEPVECRGKQSIFELPDDVKLKVLRQIAD